MLKTLRFRVVAIMAAVMSLIILSAQEVHAQVVIDDPSFQAPPPPGLFSTPGRAPAAPCKEVATWVHWQGWEAAFTVTLLTGACTLCWLLGEVRAAVLTARLWLIAAVARPSVSYWQYQSADRVWRRFGLPVSEVPSAQGFYALMVAMHASVAAGLVEECSPFRPPPRPPHLGPTPAPGKLAHSLGFEAQGT